MGYPTKVQLINRKESRQWYINFPAAVAQAMDFRRGEVVEWEIADRSTLVLKRENVPSVLEPKKKRPGSSASSKSSSKKQGAPSASRGRTSGRAS
jgi:hypothetical protein